MRMCILACRQLDVLRWMRNPVKPEVLPCPARFSTNMCEEAAKQGAILMLRWLRCQGCPWGQAGHSAFRAGRIDVLYEMKCLSPAYLWGGPDESASNSCLRRVITAAALSDNESSTKAEFYDEVVIRCLKRLPWATKHAQLVAKSGRVGPMRWLLQHRDLSDGADAQVLIAAACGNQVPMLSFLHTHCLAINQTPPMVLASIIAAACAAAVRKGALEALNWLCDQAVALSPAWSPVCCTAACGHGQLRVLDWLGKHVPSSFWTEQCWLQAVQHGQLDVLEWLVHLQPPCPCPADICEHAIDDLDGTAATANFNVKAQIFRWLREHGYAWSLESALNNIDLVVASGDLEHLHMMPQPHYAQDRTQLDKFCKSAAKHGHIQTLQWLLQGQNSSYTLPSKVCQHALTYDQLEMIQHLMTRTPRARFPNNLGRASHRCLTALAKAGCPFNSRRRLRELVQSYYVFVGWTRWACRQPAPAEPAERLQQIRDAHKHKVQNPPDWRSTLLGYLSLLEEGPRQQHLDQASDRQKPLQMIAEFAFVSPSDARILWEASP